MTGTRADYPRIKPVLKILREKKILNNSFYILKVEKKFGFTRGIKKYKFKFLKKFKIFQMMTLFQE